MNNFISKEIVERAFHKIEGERFSSFGNMEKWFKDHLGDVAAHVSIRECDGINSEIESGLIDVDYTTDCTFGEDVFGMEYADFTLDYIMDNAQNMLVTFARWN